MHSLLTPILSYFTPPQVRQLFPSARGLDNTWHSVVKIQQSLYVEAPGMDPYRPDQVREKLWAGCNLFGTVSDLTVLLSPLLRSSPQATPVPNFFLAGSYTKQDYIDSMEGATLSGRQCAAEVR